MTDQRFRCPGCGAEWAEQIPEFAAMAIAVETLCRSCCANGSLESRVATLREWATKKIRDERLAKMDRSGMDSRKELAKETERRTLEAVLRILDGEEA